MKVSVIVPVGARQANIVELYDNYRHGLEALGVPYECIFVLDGPQPAAAAGLKELASRHGGITIVSLTRSFGESTALMAGFQQASGEIVLTLPAYFQIEGSEIPKLVHGLESADLVIGERHPRAGSWVEKLRRDAFHSMIATVTGVRFHDLGCSARAMKRRVLEEISLYGDQHRFLPLLATRQGFRVNEMRVRQSALDRFEGHYRTREYAHRVLDIFTVFFLVRFTKKPLRFFGMLGVTTFGIGLLCTAWVIIERLFMYKPLADRPALLLSTLLVVLGLQLFALGLLGELIIFTHAREAKDYQIDRVIHYPGPAPASAKTEEAAYLPGAVP
jgi:glycosyltransferase involved in cell wall biosynthesis